MTNRWFSRFTKFLTRTPKTSTRRSPGQTPRPRKAPARLLLESLEVREVPAINISDATLLEGDTGNLNMTFNVSLTSTATTPVTVNFTTVNGTANANSDFVVTTGTVTIPVGSNSAPIIVPIIGDTTREANETFAVQLSNATGDTIADAEGVGTINDNDADPTATVTSVSVTEGNSGTVNAILTVQLSGPNFGQAVVIDYFTADGPQVAVSPPALNLPFDQDRNNQGAEAFGSPPDYVPVPAGTVTIAPGATSATIAIAVRGDQIVENDQAFTVTLAAPVPGDGYLVGPASPNNTTADNQATVTILDDDNPTVTSIVAVPAPTPEGGAGQFSFLEYVVTLDQLPAFGRPVSLNFTTTTTGSATPNTDFMATSGTLILQYINNAPPSQTTASIFVPVFGDVVDEADETVVVTLTPVANVNPLSPSTTSATGTILDDDGPTIVINDVSVTEGNSGTTNAVFVITQLDAGGVAATSPQPTVISVVTSDGVINPATAGVDYIATPQPPFGPGNLATTVTIPAGQSSITVSIAVQGDLAVEADETFTVSVFDASNGGNQTPISTADGVGTGTILDDDVPTVVSVLDSANNPIVVPEFGGGFVPFAEFVITLDQPATQDVTIQFATVAGSGPTGATAGTDFLATTGTLTIPAGQTNATVNVPVLGDRVDEPNETFTLTLTPVGGTVAISSAQQTTTATITDDDGPPVLVISDVIQNEGPAGTTQFQFTASLRDADTNQPVTTFQDVTFNFATSNGTAVAGTDFTQTTGALTIPTGSTSVTFNVPVLGNASDQPSRNFFVNLSNVNNAVLDNSDVLGGANGLFDIGEANGFTFPSTGTGTIRDDDGTPQVTIGHVSITEGNSGTPTANLTVTLGNTSASNVVVNFTTADGPAAPPAYPFGASAGSDYQSTTGTLTIPAGSLTGTVQVPVLSDNAVESNEVFFVQLTGATNASITPTVGDVGTVTILDDDVPTVISFVPSFTLNEGDASGFQGVIDFTVTLNQAPARGRPVSINFSTADGTATASGASPDYTAVTGQILISDITSDQISVPILGDTIDEADETFFVNLTAANSSVTIPAAQAQATGTVTDDDSPTVSVNNAVAVAEGNSGNVNILFPVVLSAPSAQATVITFQTLDLSQAPFDPVLAQRIAALFAAGGAEATAGTDYLSTANGTLTIPAGQTTGTISVSVVGDTTLEPNESFLVNLLSSQNGTFVPSVPNQSIDPAATVAIGTILDDDTPAITSFTVNSVVEPNAGGVAFMQFVFALDQAAQRPFTIQVMTAGQTATPNVDFLPVTRTITFGAGTTTGTIEVPILGDNVDEQNETLTVTISGATDLALGTSVPVPQTLTATGTIIDDDLPGSPNVDPTPQLVVSSASVLEGNTGTSNLVFTVSLVNVNPSGVQTPAASGSDVTFIASTAAATGAGTAAATVGTDFTSTTTTLTIPAGQTSATFVVPVVGETTQEPNEVFLVNLTSATNANIRDTLLSGPNGQGTGTIINDDGVPVVNAGAATVVEGNAGTVTLNFVVNVTNPTSQQVVASFNVTAGTATAGTDFVVTSGTVTIPAGQSSATIPVTVNGDTLDEAHETVILTLSNVSNNAVAGTLVSTGTITDDDGPDVSVAAADATVTEGAAGTTTTVDVVVSLATASTTKDTTVTFVVNDGTATAPDDFVTQAGTVTIPQGQTSATITVVVNGDDLVEGDEGFTVTVSSPSAGAITTDTASITITDDDVPPVISLDPTTATVNEADGTLNQAIVVSLDTASAVDVTFDLTTTDDTATAGTDFTSATQTVTIPAGQTSATVTVAVPITADTDVEGDEAFTITVGNITGGASVSPTAGTVTVTITDAVSGVTVDNPTAAEGQDLTFTVTLAQAAAADTTFNVAVTGTATAGTDFLAPPTTVTVLAGQTTATITVSTNSDTIGEGNETVILTLTDSTGATVATGTGTITDGTPPLTFTLNSPTVAEGNGTDANALNFVVTVSQASTTDTVLNVAVSGGSATAGTDFTAPATTVIIPANATSATIAIAVLADGVVEPDETVVLTLTDSNNATVATGTGTITNDDQAQVVATLSGTVTVTEGDTGTATAVFTVTLDQASNQPVTLTYATTGGSAAAGTDFVTQNDTLTIAAGQTSATFTVAVVGDFTIETDESFTVSISNPSGNATLGASTTATGAITNDDLAGTIQLSGTTFTGGEGGAATITITRSGGMGDGVTVVVTPTLLVNTAFSADASDIGSLAPATATFNGGETSVSITLPVGTGGTGTLVDDALVEGRETFGVSLSNPSQGGILGTQTAATVTIIDNDGDADQQYINAVYRQLLGRQVDASGLDYWNDVLKNGVPGFAPGFEARFFFVFNVTTVLGDEFRTGLIQDIYQNYFGRAADQTGLNSALTFLRNGGTLDQLKANLIASDEYFATAGGTAQGYLNALFQDTLGRPFSGSPPAGVDVSNPSGRFNLAFGILNSPEADLFSVRDYYQRLLNISNPDQEGLNFWSSILLGIDANGAPRGFATEDQVIAGMATFIDPATSR